MIKLDKKTVIEALVLIAIFAGVTYILYALGMIEFFTDRQRLIAFISRHRSNAVLLFIGLQIVQVVAAPVPGEVSGFVGGMLFGPFWGIVFSTIGLTLGSWLAFGLARILGRPLVELVANPETIKRYDYVMKHKGMFFAFLMFLIPGFPKDLLSYLLGLGHMRQRDFLVVSTAGRLLGTTLLTIGGTYFRDERYGAFFTVVGISIGAILLAMIYRERIERWFRMIRAGQRLKSSGSREKRGKKGENPGNAGKRPR
jgi:uncharacterized membrane protein YdjX (TVP38/TMEM64 family)